MDVDPLLGKLQSLSPPQDLKCLSDSMIRGDFDYLFFCRICTYIRSNNEVLKKIGLDKESYIHPKCPTDIS